MRTVFAITQDIVIDFYRAVPWPAVLAVVLLLGLVAPVTMLAAAAGRRRAALAEQVAWAPPRDDEDHARYLRILADDGDMAVWYTPTARPRPLDERTAVLAVDPTLKPAEVVEMVEHVAHGAGSVVSTAAMAVSTHLRTPAQQAELEAAWDEALLEVPLREAEAEERAFFAEFRGRLNVAVGTFRAATARADHWLAYLHDDETECPSCAVALGEISSEYRKLTEHTGEMSRRELAELLAA